MKYVECYKCHQHQPITYVRARTIEVESGRSSGALTYKGWGSSGGWTNQERKFRKVGGGLSYTEGRTYYRNVKVYICEECLADERDAQRAAAKASKRRWSIFWIVVLLAGAYVWIQQ